MNKSNKMSLIVLPKIGIVAEKIHKQWVEEMKTADREPNETEKN